MQAPNDELDFDGREVVTAVKPVILQGASVTDSTLSGVHLVAATPCAGAFLSQDNYNCRLIGGQYSPNARLCCCPAVGSRYRLTS